VADLKNARFTGSATAATNKNGLDWVFVGADW
jgi:hypothetical protein